MQGSIALAQGALQATAAGASTAGQQAGTNMNNLLKPARPARKQPPA
jgi:hypothetical protein